jgi:hypothetical protein
VLLNNERGNSGGRMPKFQLTRRAEGRPDVVIQGEFADSEHVLLTRFLEQYEQLAESKPLREGFPCRLAVKWSRDKEFRVETTLPDNDTLGILLHRLRPFILENESATFKNIVSIIGKCVDDPPLRELLKRERRLYDGRDFQQQVKIATDDIIVNSEQLLYDWLNSHEYHRDPDKRQSVGRIFQRMPGGFMRGVLVSMLVDKVRAIRNVASIVAVLLNKSNRFEFAGPAEPSEGGRAPGP